MNSGLVLLARTGSTRLPGKSLQPICGRPLLVHQIERLVPTASASVVVLATTDLPEDDRLCALAAEAGIKTFRGCAENVVRRLVEVAEAHSFDFAAVVGGDDVFCGAALVDTVITEYRRTGADFITIRDLPFGVSPFGVSTTALNTVVDLIGSGSADGWDRYLTETGMFHTVIMEQDDPALHHPELRLDVDYPEDLDLVRAIYDRLYRPGRTIDLREVIALLTVEEPALASVNRGAHEKWLANRAGFAPVPESASQAAKRVRHG